MKITNDYQEAGYCICTRLNLSNLGGLTPIGDFGDDEMSHKETSSSLKAFKKNLRNAVQEYDNDLIESCEWDDDEEHPALSHRMAFVEAVTSVPGQEKIEGYLKELGFQSIGPFSKKKHSYTKVTVWVMHAPAFLEAIKEANQCAD